MRIPQSLIIWALLSNAACAANAASSRAPSPRAQTPAQAHTDAASTLDASNEDEVVEGRSGQCRFRTRIPIAIRDGAGAIQGRVAPGETIFVREILAHSHRGRRECAVDLESGAHVYALLGVGDVPSACRELTRRLETSRCLGPCESQFRASIEQCIATCPSSARDGFWTCYHQCVPEGYQSCVAQCGVVQEDSVVLELNQLWPPE